MSDTDSSSDSGKSQQNAQALNAKKGKRTSRVSKYETTPGTKNAESMETPSSAKKRKVEGHSGHAPAKSPLVAKTIVDQKKPDAKTPDQKQKQPEAKTVTTDQKQPEANMVTTDQKKPEAKTVPDKKTVHTPGPPEASKKTESKQGKKNPLKKEKMPSLENALKNYADVFFQFGGALRTIGMDLDYLFDRMLEHPSFISKLEEKVKTLVQK